MVKHTLKILRCEHRSGVQAFHNIFLRKKTIWKSMWKRMFWFDWFWNTEDGEEQSEWKNVNVLTTNCLPGPFEELANVNSNESSYYSCEKIKSYPFSKLQISDKLLFFFFFPTTFTSCEMGFCGKLTLLEAFSVGIYLFNVNDKNTITRCEICSKLTKFATTKLTTS